MKRKELLESIASIVCDYRIDEIDRITSMHVEKWVNQFDKDDQIIILNELNHILKKYYISKEQAKTYLKSTLLDNRISGSNKKEYFKKLNFINIQDKGYSQKDMLELVNEILQEEYGLDINDCGGSDDYMYLDDCIFTGNRFRYDIVPWIEKNKFNKVSKLIMYHIAKHSEGYNYAIKYIKNSAKTNNLKLSYCSHISINNEKNVYSSPEILWPLTFVDDDNLNNYYDKIKQKLEINECMWKDKCFRKDVIDKEGLFTSSESRDIVEIAFLKVGARLVESATNPSESMRPLGFEKLESMGFGSMFITYRNIANNCPLALWYGDRKKIDGPLRNWYPLFIRKFGDELLNFEGLFG